MVVQENIEAYVCQTDDFLTPEQAADMLKISKWTIKRKCEQHELPAIKIAGKWRISFQGLQKQAEANVSREQLL